VATEELRFTSGGTAFRDLFCAFLFCLAQDYIGISVLNAQTVQGFSVSCVFVVSFAVPEDIYL
jgi:hypothetical protein